MRRIVQGKNLPKNMKENPKSAMTQQQALFAAGQILKRDAVQRAPVLSGHLRNSAYVHPYTSGTHGGPMVAVGFTANYAAIVHNPVDGKLPHQRGGYSPSGRAYHPDDYSHVGEPYFLKKASNSPTVRNRMLSVSYGVMGPV